MRKYQNYLLYLLSGILIYINSNAYGQQGSTQTKNNQPVTKSRVLSVDSAVITKHQVTIKGKLIPYTATA